MIQAHSICLSYGSQVIFDHISFTIGQHQRIGLVGRNGSGKSTLLKAIIDPSVLDSGTISLLRGKKIAYMPQDVVLQSSRSIVQETMQAFGDLEALKKEILELEHMVEHDSYNYDALERYAHLQEQLATLQEDKMRAQAERMLAGLGFSKSQLEQPVSSLSVGWKMRVVLAKLLLQNADFYLFDEPTNHLDLLTKEWFLHFLKNASFGFLLVCHERYFLDELCTEILELERGQGKMYSGNYSTYEKQKEHDLQLLIAAQAQQEREIQQKMRTIERFRASASKAAMAQSMLKAVNKIERITLPPSAKNVTFNFPAPGSSGKIVLTVKNVSQSFGSKKIFEHVSCEIERGQKASIIAPNGGGKTTLFNLIIGKLPLQHGSITFGHNVTHALFNQDQNSALNPSSTILQTIKDRCPKKTEQEIRSMLGAFLFSGDDVQKKISVLSGGEKNRVGMVCVLMQDANFLLLDEPTNHLDIPSKEILLKALENYKGTILFVSHDRDFVNQLATHIIDLTPQGAHTYVGNYDSYVYQKNMLATKPTVQPTITQPQPSKPVSSNSFELRKKSKSLENKIDTLEKQKCAVQESFATLQYGTPDYAAAEKRLRQVESELDACLAEWENLQQQLN